ncbi:helix-turn-helix domain-containing protein [Acetobacter peroxydans]|uniref:Uncharacterized protein n=1 Tax=Acetobacter peroxydans TaxID=104098 RepID=A0A4Y3TXN4_9PROT|nr:hypothetical protein [Acetobacter peroxydans]NHO17171.1 hypothetical protein [Acetobacter peroxydans]GBR35601.1 hypothetical protein AA13755_1276 [Acetobacter peroxydans NBRC 13755]GBR39415.1 hypothetical protein AA0475_0178 [Acetobacter peroxydans]GEB86209.1 hypothetical protein APE01nite_20060 [Acetobacter peroxydans]
MASRSEDTFVAEDETITHGSGAVLADLSYADAEERQTKPRLAHTINGVIARRWLNQVTAAGQIAAAAVGRGA